MKTGGPLVVLFTLTALSLLSSCGNQRAPLYKNAQIPVDRRIDDLLPRMTLEEKIDMVSGGSGMDTRPVERLGIPALKMNDGPLGVRYWSPNLDSTKGSFGATAFPAGVAMAATW